MEQAENHGASMTVANVAVGLLAGLVVLVLLFPASGIDPIPPQCFSVFGYTVPCGEGWAVAAGAATAGVVGVSLWLKSRRR
jgi:hypothetical protein